MASPPPVAVLMIGTGEYTTGFGANSSQTDKGAGVVGLTMFDLRKRGYVGDLHMAGVNGTKLPAIRAHMKSVIGGLYPKSDFDFSLISYPEDGKVDPKAYLTALDALPKSSAVIIFTPDDIHFEQALAAVERGHHVLVTKPVVKTLDEHARRKSADAREVQWHAVQFSSLAHLLSVAAAAAAHNVLVAVEVHKRWDPLYTDACKWDGLPPLLRPSTLPRTSLRPPRPPPAHAGRLLLHERVHEPAQAAARDLPRVGRDLKRHFVLPQLVSGGVASLLPPERLMRPPLPTAPPAGTTSTSTSGSWLVAHAPCACMRWLRLASRGQPWGASARTRSPST